MALATLLLVFLDQWTKYLASVHLAGRGPISLLGGTVILVYVRNRGAFLSLGSSLPPLARYLVLVALPAAVIAFLAWVMLFGRTRLRDGKTGGPFLGQHESHVAAVLVIAGGLGNLMDRILFGQVRDFLNFGLGNLRTGIMNAADLYIMAALLVLAIALLRLKNSTLAQGNRDQKGGEALGSDSDRLS